MAKYNNDLTTAAGIDGLVNVSSTGASGTSTITGTPDGTGKIRIRTSTKYFFAVNEDGSLRDGQIEGVTGTMTLENNKRDLVISGVTGTEALTITVTPIGTAKFIQLHETDGFTENKDVNLYTAGSTKYIDDDNSANRKFVTKEEKAQIHTNKASIESINDEIAGIKEDLQDASSGLGDRVTELETTVGKYDATGDTSTGYGAKIKALEAADAAQDELIADLQEKVGVPAEGEEEATGLFKSVSDLDIAVKNNAAAIKKNSDDIKAANEEIAKKVTSAKLEGKDAVYTSTAAGDTLTELTTAATANAVVKRDANGDIIVNAISDTEHKTDSLVAVNRGYVDTALEAIDAQFDAVDTEVAKKEDKANKVDDIYAVADEDVSTKYTSVKAVKDAIADVNEMAAGKTQTFAISASTANAANKVFDKATDKITLTADEVSKLVPIGGKAGDITITGSNLKVGDVFYYAGEQYPDRWVGEVTADSVSLYKLETAKCELLGIKLAGETGNLTINQETRVAEIPFATDSVAGIVKVEGSQGIVLEDDGNIKVDFAQQSEIGTDLGNTKVLDGSVATVKKVAVDGLFNNTQAVSEKTEEQKTALRESLDVTEVSVESTAVGENNVLNAIKLKTGSGSERTYKVMGCNLAYEEIE